MREGGRAGSLHRIDTIGLWAIALVALGIVVRCWRLGEENLWIDEVQTLTGARGAPFHPMLERNVPPLYYLLVNLLLTLGESDLILRLPALVAGLATLAIAFLVGRELSPERDGRPLLVLAACNPFLVWYAREARGYALFILAGSVGTLALLRIARGATRGDFALLAFGLSLAMWSHPYGLLYGVSALAALWILRAPRLPSFLALAAAGLSYAPWMVAMAVLPKAPAGTDKAFSLAAIGYTPYELLLGKSFGPTTADLHTRGLGDLVRTYPVHVAAGTLVIALAMALGARAARERRGLALLAFALVPIPIALSAWVLPLQVTYNVRYVAASAVPVLALVAAGAQRYGRRLAPVFLVPVLVVMAFSSISLQVSPRYRKEQVRDVARRVERSHRGTYLVFSSEETSRVFARYYRGGLPVVTGEPPLRGDFWVVESRPWTDHAWPERLGQIRQHAVAVDRVSAMGVRAWLFRPAGPSRS